MIAAKTVLDVKCDCLD